ncbi:MAG: choice-of-anchor D domain-containing protein [Planctomycetaceae bacterium]|nr:choice-of-anchor D domain-containing protein [Planctomycetaceae bacterium]
MRTARLRHSRMAPARKANASRVKGRKLSLEPLEARTLLAAQLISDDLPLLSTHGGACQCPVCTGVGLDEIPVIAPSAALTPTTASLAGLPALSSNPSATKKLYLDFNGHVQSSWGTFTNIVTPAFDQDGYRSSLSTSEVAAIREIWTRIAEDYAPFNIDVTTIDPGLSASGAARVAIGGHYSDWYGSSAGGVAYVGGYTNSMPNIAYVFEDALGNGNPRYVAEAAAHEAGHLFGLQHQAVWSGSTLVEGYNSGSGDWAPIMGTGYYASRTTWHRGTSSTGPSSIQDDMSILAGAIGWRPDDFASTTAAATSLTGGSVNLAGVIGGPADVDLWKFTTAGGSISLQLAGALYGGDLDAVLEIKNASGQTIASSAPAGSLGASIVKSLTAGTYYVAVRASSGYGNAGQFTLRGTLPPASSTVPTTSPEISVRMSGSELTDGGTASFGSTKVGTAISRTFTVTNVGQSTLSLTALSSTAMPAGFSLTSNLGDLTLTAGQSTTFTIRFNAATAGSFSGQIAIRSNDASEAVFDLRLSASAVKTTTTTSSPTTTSTTLIKRTLDNGATGFTKSGTWSLVTGRGVASDMNLAARGTGTSTATWSFTSIPNGKYQVYGSWLGASTYATNAPFTLYNGSTPVATVRASQRVNSSGLTADGANWKLLGTVTVTGGRLNVRLNNQADGTVVADAIRIVQTSSTSAADLAAADLALLAWLDQRPQSSVESAPAASAAQSAYQPPTSLAAANHVAPAPSSPWWESIEDASDESTEPAADELDEFFGSL